MSPSTPLAFQMLDDGPHEMFAIHHPVQMINVVHLDGARPVCRKRIRVVRLDGTALGPLSLLPHPALSGGLERQTTHSLCTPPHPRFTLYSCPPRTSPSGSRPGKGYQRISCKSSNNPTRRWWPTKEDITKKSCCSVGASRISTWNKPSVLNSIP